MPLSPGHKLSPYEILAFIRKGGMLVLFAIAGATGMLRAQRPVPDLVLSNGKVITVDERFTIAQAVAIKGMHATMLHILGIDHERLTYRTQGRDFRLTDVATRVAKDIFA